jgi:hypothetical protein
MQVICQFEYTHHIDGSVDVLFRNCLTRAEETRHYKTQAAAKAQVTRFGNRVLRVYHQRPEERIEVPTPLDKFYED